MHCTPACLALCVCVCGGGAPLCTQARACTHSLARPPHACVCACMHAHAPVLGPQRLEVDGEADLAAPACSRSRMRYSVRTAWGPKGFTLSSQPAGRLMEWARSHHDDDMMITGCSARQVDRQTAGLRAGARCYLRAKQHACMHVVAQRGGRLPAITWPRTRHMCAWPCDVARAIMGIMGARRGCASHRYILAVLPSSSGSSISGAVSGYVAGSSNWKSKSYLMRLCTYLHARIVSWHARSPP